MIFLNNPRKIAFLVLNEYINKKDNLKKIINKYFNNYKINDLNKRLINEICKGAVRYLLLIDFLISKNSNKSIDKIDNSILNIIRTGVYQLFFLNRVPIYSIVNESVEIAKKYAGLPSSKFVNAVLRKISQIPNINNFLEGEINKTKITKFKKLSIKYSFPEWLIKYWTEYYGFSKTEKICQSLNESSLIYLRINTLKIIKDKLIDEITNDKKLKNEDILHLNDNESEEIIFEDTIAIKSVKNIINSNYYKAGFFSIQDFSSQLAVKYFLKPKENEKILDLCAAPGGKTTYMSELMNNSGEVISIDTNKKRLKMLEDNLKRLLINNVKIIIADASRENFLDGFSSNNYQNYFDKIFIDSPCSSFGTISKNPDVKYNKKINDIYRLSDISYKIILNSHKYLKNGGKIVFYTCTISPIENQMLLEKIINDPKNGYRFDEIYLADEIINYLQKEKINKNIISKKYFEILPYYFNSEGGFISRLIKG